MNRVPLTLTRGHTQRPLVSWGRETRGIRRTPDHRRRVVFSCHTCTCKGTRVTWTNDKQRDRVSWLLWLNSGTSNNELLKLRKPLYYIRIENIRIMKRNCFPNIIIRRDIRGKFCIPAHIHTQFWHHPTSEIRQAKILFFIQGMQTAVWKFRVIVFIPSQVTHCSALKYTAISEQQASRKWDHRCFVWLDIC